MEAFRRATQEPIHLPPAPVMRLTIAKPVLRIGEDTFCVLEITNDSASKVSMPWWKDEAGSVTRKYFRLYLREGDGSGHSKVVADLTGGEPMRETDTVVVGTSGRFKSQAMFYLNHNIARHFAGAYGRDDGAPGLRRGAYTLIIETGWRDPEYPDMPWQLLRAEAKFVVIDPDGVSTPRK